MARKRKRKTVGTPPTKSKKCMFSNDTERSNHDGTGGNTAQEPTCSQAKNSSTDPCVEGQSTEQQPSNSKRYNFRQSTTVTRAACFVDSAYFENKRKRRKLLKLHETELHDACHQQADEDFDYLCKLSLEILYRICRKLPLYDMLKLQSLNRKLYEAVSMVLRVRNKINFTEGQYYGDLPSKFTDCTLYKFLTRCPDVEEIHGFHPTHIAKRQHRGIDILTIPGIIAALGLCNNLEGIEISNIFLLEAILNYLPKVRIIGRFANRNGDFPISPLNKLTLTSHPNVEVLHLIGVVLPELPSMPSVKHLYLQCTKLTNAHPFRDFEVPKLQTFVMKNCAGPRNAILYVPMVTGLAAARSLTRLELIRVPFLGGLIQHVVEDSWRIRGFRQLNKITFGSCKHALEVDLGYLIITCAHRLEELFIQPSLSKDSVFSALNLADVSFPHFRSLHIGYADDFPNPEKWTNEQLVMHGLADVVEHPPTLTDIGMKAAGQAFPNMRSLTVYNCPLLQNPHSWRTPGTQAWHSLKHLVLHRCHSVRLESFCQLVPLLVALESLHLEQMFREPPKGCSRVGLSAGTGLGVSSALVSNNGAVPDNAVDNNNIPANQDEDANDNNNQPIANQNANMEEGDQENDDLVVVIEDEEQDETEGNEDNRKDIAAALLENDDNECSPGPSTSSKADTVQASHTEDKDTSNAVPKNELSGTSSSNGDGVLDLSVKEKNASPAGDKSNTNESEEALISHADEEQKRNEKEKKKGSERNESNTSSDGAINHEVNHETKLSVSSANYTEQKTSQNSNLSESSSLSFLNVADNGSKEEMGQDGPVASSTPYKSDGAIINNPPTSIVRQVLSANNRTSGTTMESSKDGASDGNQGGGKIDTVTKENCDSADIMKNLSDSSNTNSNENVESKTNQAVDIVEGNEIKISENIEQDLKQETATDKEYCVSTSKHSAILDPCLCSNVNQNNDEVAKCGPSNASAMCTHCGSDHADVSFEADLNMDDKHPKYRDSMVEPMDLDVTLMYPSEHDKVITEFQNRYNLVTEDGVNSDCDYRSDHEDKRVKEGATNMQTGECQNSKGGTHKKPKGFPADDEKIIVHIANTDQKIVVNLSNKDVENEDSQGLSEQRKNNTKKENDDSSEDKMKNDNKLEKSPETCSSQQSSASGLVCGTVESKTEGQSQGTSAVYKSKGKSLTGKKKGIVKKSSKTSAHDKELPSCSSQDSAPNLESSENKFDNGLKLLDEPDIRTSNTDDASLCGTLVKSEDKSKKLDDVNPESSTFKDKEESTAHTLPSEIEKNVPAEQVMSQSGKTQCLGQQAQSPPSPAQPVLNSNRVHQSCQAVCEEIRESTKAKKGKDAGNDDDKAKDGAVDTGDGNGDGNTNMGSDDKNKRKTSSGGQSSDTGVGVSHDTQRRVTRSQSRANTSTSQKQTSVAMQTTPSSNQNEPLKIMKRKPNMVDRATSTSDPVMEDDHIQVLSMTSKSLVHLSLHMVGVTDLLLVDCPRLQKVGGSACRVLKKVVVNSASRLVRVDFRQCPKLDQTSLLSDVLKGPNTKNKQVFLRPMKEYDPIEIERLLFTNTNYHFILVEDHSPHPEDSLQTKLRVSQFPDVHSTLSLFINTFCQMPESKQSTKNRKFTFPFGRSPVRLQGVFEAGGAYDILTDLPWIEALLAMKPVMGPIQEKELNGPNRSPEEWNPENGIREEVFDKGDTGVVLYPYTILVYINTCDTSGAPTEDMYA